MGFIDSAALKLVDGYRTHLSPRKGWKCASGVAGNGTCSTVIREAVAAQGAVRAAAPAVAQFARCASSARGLRVGGMDTRVEGVCCCGPIPIPFRF